MYVLNPSAEEQAQEIHLPSSFSASFQDTNPGTRSKFP
jgi:hypothetical protein